MVGYEIMLLANVHKGSAKWQSDQQYVSTSIISLYTFFRFFSSSEFKYRTALQGLKQNKLQLLNWQIYGLLKITAFGITKLSLRKI